MSDNFSNVFTSTGSGTQNFAQGKGCVGSVVNQRVTGNGNIISGSSSEAVTILSGRTEEFHVVNSGEEDLVIKIGDKEYEGKSVQLIIDGKNIKLDDLANIEVTIIGDCKKVKGNIGKLVVNGDVGNIEVSAGNVKCDNVKGRVSVDSGTVNCGKVGGRVSVDAGVINHN